MTTGVTLVTGATGFLGRHVCESLGASRHTVRGLSRSGAGMPSGVQPFFCADLLDRPAIRSSLDGVENVVHLAARAHVMRDSSLAALDEYRRTNVEGTRVLLEESIAAGVRRLVMASSVKAVGESNEHPWTEQTDPAPVDPYGISKLEAERVVAELASPTGMHATILRFPLVYGPGMRANMLRLFEIVDRGMPLPLASVRNRRSLVFSGNAVAAIVRVMSSPAAAGETFFASDREALSTPDLVRAIASALRRPVRLLAVPPSVFRAAGRIGDLVSPLVAVPIDSGAVARLLDSLTVDASKLTRLTGFNPPISIEDGLRETALWYRTRAGSRM